MNAFLRLHLSKRCFILILCITMLFLWLGSFWDAFDFANWFLPFDMIVVGLVVLLYFSVSFFDLLGFFFLFKLILNLFILSQYDELESHLFFLTGLLELIRMHRTIGCVYLEVLFLLALLFFEFNVNIFRSLWRLAWIGHLLVVFFKI